MVNPGFSQKTKKKRTAKLLFNFLSPYSVVDSGRIKQFELSATPFSLLNCFVKLMIPNF